MIEIEKRITIVEESTKSAQGLTDWIGVWLGTDFFAGYIEDGRLDFTPESNYDKIIIKSFGGTMD